MIETDSYIPIYQQVSKIIQDKINSGDLKPGDRIGSIAELVKIYSISRVTAVSAVEDLVKKGFVVTRQGKGTFVKNGHLDEDLLSLKSFVEISEGKAIKYDINITKFEKVPTTEYLLDLFDNGEDEIFYVQRVHSYKGQPIALCNMFIPTSIIEKSKMNKESIESQPVFTFLERSGLAVVEASQTISAIAAEEEVSKILRVNLGDPILFAERVSYDEEKRPIMCANFYYRADSYSYSVKLRRTKNKDYLH